MEIIHWRGIVESLLFAAGDEGLTMKQICEVLELDEIMAVQIMKELEEEYKENGNRGITLVQMADTYQLVTKKEYSPYLKKLVESPHTSTLSQAALETLAIIAYKQPITRIEIEEIRGVKTDRPLHTLMGKRSLRKLVELKELVEPICMEQRKNFLDYFGLKNIEDLPHYQEMEEDTIQEEADLFFGRFEDL